MSGKKSKRPPALRVVSSDRGGAGTGKSKSPRKPAPPKWLSPYARSEWMRLSKDLHAQGLFTCADRGALEQLCEAYATARRGREILARQAEDNPENGALIIKTVKGNVIVNPILPVINRAVEQIIKISAEFGLTPASRDRVSRIEPPEEDPVVSRYFD